MNRMELVYNNAFFFFEVVVECTKLFASNPRVYMYITTYRLCRIIYQRRLNCLYQIQARATGKFIFPE